MNQSESKLRILVRGANDVGSAVAHILFTAGYSVTLHDTSQPTTARRKMSFSDAIFDGRATLENVAAERIDNNLSLNEILAEHKIIPISLMDIFALIKNLHPHILIDARMRKHQQPEVQLGLARLTIGLGPNFIAGETTDLAIETGWGESLGRIVQRGATHSLSGEPREIDGHARDRYVYAPNAGMFRTQFQIGDLVAQGQEIARVDSIPLFAPITGTLRGLTHNGVWVALKTKVIEVDPRARDAQIFGIGERPARIAQGVFEAIQSWAEKQNISCQVP